MSTRVTTAVILAAGQGTRLRGMLDDRPKGFLALGERPIVAESVRRLAAHGITKVVVVTGYRHEFYDALARASGGLVRTVSNDVYATSGSLHSLWCAGRGLGDEPFLLLESDLVYEPRALGVLLDGEAEDAILLSGPTGAGDEVYVEARDGLLVAMSKDRAALGAGVLGELVGISRISAALYGRLRRVAQARLPDLRASYETDGLVEAAAERPIRCTLVPDLLWGEIDDPAHLARVRDGVYPAVARLDAALDAAAGDRR